MLLSRAKRLLPAPVFFLRLRLRRLPVDKRTKYTYVVTVVSTIALCIHPITLNDGFTIIFIFRLPSRTETFLFWCTTVNYNLKLPEPLKNSVHFSNTPGKFEVIGTPRARAWDSRLCFRFVHLVYMYHRHDTIRRAI